MEERKIILVNTMCYKYPNGDIKYVKFKCPLLIEKEKTVSPTFTNLEDDSFDEKNDNGNQERSVRRSSSTIAHYCHSNSFEYFVTLTLSPEYFIDRNDLSLCNQQVSQWLNLQRIKYGKFKYILVPEYHPTSGAIHYHGVIGGYNGKFTKENTRKGREVYHLEEWQNQLGFTDCELIVDIGKVSNYIRKYVTKDMIYLFGKKKYLCSKGLALPDVEYNVRIPEELEGEYENDMCITGYKKHVDTN